MYIQICKIIYAVIMYIHVCECGHAYLRIMYICMYVTTYVYVCIYAFDNLVLKCASVSLLYGLYKKIHNIL